MTAESGRAGKPAAAASMGDLLDLGIGSEPPKNVLEEVKELSELLGTTSTSVVKGSGIPLKFQTTHP